MRLCDIQNAVKVSQKQEPNSTIVVGGGGGGRSRVKHFYRGDKNKRNEPEFGHDGLKSGKTFNGR